MKVKWVHFNEELPPKEVDLVFTCYLEDKKDFTKIFSGVWNGLYTAHKTSLVIDYGDEDDWYPATHWLKKLKYPKIK